METLIPNKSYPVIRNIFIIASLTPTAWIVACYFSNGLMPNPFTTISKTFGHAALVIILLSLAISPLRLWLTLLFSKLKCRWGRRISDWNFLVRIRRPVGLMAFFYACLHLLSYLYFELDFTWEEFVYEVSTRRIIAVGVFAFAIIAVLAFTSLTLVKRRMGKWWLLLHKLNYLLCILVIVHYWMFIKITTSVSILYLLLATILLSYRAFIYIWNPRFRGDETKVER